jgi:MoaA/NifB/PqqE/SkfB family radical SAM enzyme
MDKKSVIVGIIADLATQLKAVNEAPLCVVGSAAHMLNGADVLPRDIDVLLPATVSYSVFADLVLQPLGYEDAGDYRWRHHASKNSYSHPIDLSYPLERTDRNLFYSCPEHWMSWNIDSHFTKSIDLGENCRLTIPNEALSIILLIKSISDKIFMIPSLQGADADFWRELLRNDIDNLRKLIRLYDSVLLLEDLQEVIRLIPNDPSVRLQILQGCEFARQALDCLKLDSASRVNQMGALLRNYFGLPNSRRAGSVTGPADLRILHTAHKETIYSSKQTGAIYLEASGDEAGAKLSLPLFVDVQLNSSCNLKCAHCDYRMDGRTLALPVLREKLRNMADSGVQQVNFGEASEALLYDDLPSAIRMAAEFNLIPNLTTNLSMRPSAELLRTIGECCGAVATSVDRFHFRGFPGNMMTHPITERIHAVVNQGVFVILNTVYDRDDTEGVSYVLEYAEKLGCQAVCLIRRFFHDGTTYRKLPMRDFGRLLEQIVARRESPLQIGFHSSDPVTAILREPHGPQSSWALPMITDARHTMFLDADGAYRPNSFSTHEQRVFGTVAEAWSSDIFNRFRANSGGVMQLI